MLSHVIPVLLFCPDYAPIAAPNFHLNLTLHPYLSIDSIPSRMAPGRPKVHIPPCTFCGKIFNRSHHLRRHERIRKWPFTASPSNPVDTDLFVDTQEKPFQCHCGRAFARQ